jgi:hypothetical protein
MPTIRIPKRSFGRHGTVSAAGKAGRDKAEQTFKDLVARLGHATRK